MLKRDAVWLGANALLAAAFLWFTSSLWIEPDLRDIPGASGGGPIIFMLALLWLLAPLSPLILLGLGLAVRSGLRDARWGRLGAVCLTIAAWIGAIWFSASLQGS